MRRHRHYLFGYVVLAQAFLLGALLVFRGDMLVSAVMKNYNDSPDVRMDFGAPVLADFVRLQPRTQAQKANPDTLAVRSPPVRRRPRQWRPPASMNNHLLNHDRHLVVEVSTHQGRGGPVQADPGLLKAPGFKN